MQAWALPAQAFQTVVLDAIRSDARLRDDCFVLLNKAGVVVVGPDDDSFVGLMSILQSQLEFQLPNLKRWSWTEVQSAAIELARMLSDCDAGAPSLILGMPRGGLIIAALVAYSSGAKVEQMNGAFGGRQWVIDDLAISGLRMLQTLDQCQDASTIVGLLAATDGAMQAISGHPAVLHVKRVEKIEAIDWPGAEGRSQEEWQKRWPGYDPRIWFGRCKHHVFPWKEPDSVYKNPVTQESERGFPLVSRQYCISTGKPRIPLLNTEESLDDLFGGHIWPVCHQDRLLLVNIQDGSLQELTGSAKPLLMALKAADRHAALTEMSQAFEVPVEVLQNDLVELAQMLKAAGLLAPPKSETNPQ